MSVICNTADIPPALGEKLHQHLTVVSTPPPKKFNFWNQDQPQMFYQEKKVECFTFFDAGTTRYVCLPFSYYYHYLTTTLPRLPKPQHSVNELKFVGNLLPRQQAIKDESLEILQRTGSILLCLHTGFGKTIFTLYLVSCLGMKAVVLCHRNIIIQQWLESCAKYLPSLNAVEMDIAQYKKNPSCWKDVDVLVCSVINVPKIPAAVFKQFGCVVVDEVHTICTNEFSKSLHYLVPSYLIGLSATPFRSDGMDTLLQLYFGPEMIVRNMRRFFNAYRLNTGFIPQQEDTHWSSLLRSQAQDVDRNKLICKLVWYFRKRTILVLVKHKGQANKLKKWLLKLGIDTDVFMDTMKKVNYDCNVLVATYSKGGVGFDHPKLDMLITGADVKENFMQYLGRVFRRDDTVPIYVDMRDNLKVLQDHAKVRLDICKEVGAEVKDFYKSFTSFNLWTDWLDEFDLDV